MKYLILSCEGLAGAPVEELGERTPLELAKAPNLNLLAKKGQVGRASFIPRSLSASPGISAMSTLGFDPQEFYTGVAPLEAAAMGITQNDTEIAFRCDFVTVLDNLLIDNSASHISPKESKLLTSALNKKLATDHIKFYSTEGHKNILIIKDPEKADRLDELECYSPSKIIGKEYSKFLPKGEGAAMLVDLMNRSKEILEGHEINRVRIDLGENPANMIWPWGQGKKPKLPNFKQRFDLSASIFSEIDFISGLGKLLGLKVAGSVETSLDDVDLAFIYKAADECSAEPDSLKSKIRLIEEFDSKIVGPASKLLERFENLKILVVTDQNDGPFLISGRGVLSEDVTGFNEKTASKSLHVFDEGHKLLEYFLKGA